MSEIRLLRTPYDLTDNEAELYLPHSVGFEIECGINRSYSTSEIKDAINIIVEKYKPITDHFFISEPSDYENRFRIPKGKMGLHCLYDICKLLKKYYLLNTSSGIHYHVDSPWVKSLDSNATFNDNDKIVNDYVIQQLESWDYKGTYNIKKISFVKGCWVVFRVGLGTIEYRIGEMTFDFSLIIKRMSHVCALTNVLNKHYNEKGDIKTSMRNLISLLNSYNSKDSDETVNISVEEIKMKLARRYVRC